MTNEEIKELFFQSIADYKEYNPAIVYKKTHRKPLKGRHLFHLIKFGYIHPLYFMR